MHKESILSSLLLFIPLADSVPSSKELSCEEQRLIKQVRESSFSYMEIAKVLRFCDNA